MDVAKYFDSIKAWVDEAVTAGGRGEIFCIHCPVYDAGHMDNPCGANCPVAYRQFPGRMPEFWIPDSRPVD